MNMFVMEDSAVDCSRHLKRLQVFHVSDDEASNVGLRLLGMVHGLGLAEDRELHDRGVDLLSESEQESRRQ